MADRMTPEEFIELCLKTESCNWNAILLRLHQKRTARLLHALLGMVTETAEFADALKKFIFYGKELDLINLKEELGDVDWYKAIAIDELGTSMEEVWERVIAKLQARYGEKFNEEGALNRKLEVERAILEGNEEEAKLALGHADIGDRQ